MPWTRPLQMWWGSIIPLTVHLFILRASGHLSAMPALVSTLQVMAVAHDVSPLLRYLLPHLVHSVFSWSSGEGVQSL